MVDLRNGADFETFVNPVNSSGGSTAESLSQISTNTDANSGVAGSGVGSTRLTFSMSNTALTGGSNQLPGNIENAPYGKANYGVSLETGNYFTEGQHVQNEHVINCYAVGDCLEGSWMLTSSGGYRDMADEGAHPFDLQVQEDWHVFQGTCTSGCTTGATQLMTNATFGGGTQGEGRFLIDKNPAKTITAGQIVSAGGSVFATVNFTGTNFPASVLFQTTAAATSQPKNIAPGTVTLPIATSNVPAGFASNTNQLTANSGVACVADTNDSRFPNFETANYTVVDASHITLTLNKVHGSGAVIAVGGMCGYGIEQTADTVGAVRQIFPIVGTASATSLYYAAASTPVLGLTNGASTSGFQNISVPISSLVRKGNVVTATLASNLPVDVNGLTMTVSGVTDASYNGSFQVTTKNANLVTYTATGADSTSSGGTLTFLNGSYVLYPMAEVLGVYDASAKQVDGQFTLAANTVAWAPGDAVEEPHFYQQLTAADNEWITQYVPRPIQYSSAGKQYLGEVGPGMRGWQVQNGVPASNYLGGGGTHELPDDAYVVSGAWRNDLEVDAGTQALIYAHCNLHGCNRWDSGYDLFELDSATGQDALFYSPQVSEAIWTLGGQQFTFAPTGLTVPVSLTLNGAFNMGSITGTGGSSPGFTSSGTAITLGQTGDVYGATSMTIENRSGTNGAMFTDSGLDLVDFEFKGKSGMYNDLRNAFNNFGLGYGNTNGEFQFYSNITASSLGTSDLLLGPTSGQFYPAGGGGLSINVAAGTNPKAALAVNGGVSVGSYAGGTTAPSNGLIVSGKVGIGSASPSAALSVGASNQFTVDASGNVTAASYTGAATAPAGSCTTNGVWVFSQDGHATFCAAGTWVTKI